MVKLCDCPDLIQSDICEGKGNDQGHVFPSSLVPKDNHFASEACKTRCLFCTHHSLPFACRFRVPKMHQALPQA